VPARGRRPSLTAELTRHIGADRLGVTAVVAIHTLSLIMAVGPIAAIILALWLIKPSEARR
jgi:hypothetical protein